MAAKSLIRFPYGDEEVGTTLSIFTRGFATRGEHLSVDPQVCNVVFHKARYEKNGLFGL